MGLLAHKKILLGISGGIAAYKSAELTRRLIEQGADLRVVMTSAAMQFVTPLTFQALSGNPVSFDLLDPHAEAAMGHIELARWADLVLIAPASADFIARLAHGFANDLLSTLCLATTAPITVAPAMNQRMWQNAATQDNCDRLQHRGFCVLQPNVGNQACGENGPGRMQEPKQILAAVIQHFSSRTQVCQPLKGKKVIITAGPTREALDPVRYISNHSSGKMGFALAAAAFHAGADTTLIAGPVHLATPDGVQRINVLSAQDMYTAALAQAEQADLFIATAAVADYRPAQILDQKIKKSSSTLTLELIKNPDIVAAVAALPQKPVTVGFAAETHDVINYANDKLIRKNLDMIIANDVARSDIGFNAEENAVTVLSKTQQQHLPRAKKDLIAQQLIEIIAAEFFHYNSATHSQYEN